MLQSLRSLAGQRTLTSRQLPYRVRAFAAALLVLVSGSCDKCITVPEDPVLTTISVSLSATSIQVGQTVTASATGLDQNEASIATGAVTWATSPDAIANVSAGGTVTGTAPGTVAIIASAGGKQGQQTLTVTAPPDLRLDLVTASATGNIGGTIDVLATVRNQGTVAAGAFRVGFYYSTDATITTADAFSDGCSYDSGLAASTASDCSGSISVLGSLAPGTYYVGAIVDDQAQVSESNESNNARASATTTVLSTALNLVIDGLYLTQATQTYTGTVPLVAGRDALLRAFVKATQANSAMPTVRVLFYHNGILVDTKTIAASRSSVPTAIDEGTLAASWNLDVAGSMIQPGLSILAEVDPTNTIVETSESDNAFPVSGTPAALDVRTPSPFNVMLVPILQTPNGLQGDVTEANKAEYTNFASRVYPIETYNVTVHIPYSYGSALSASYDSTWRNLLSEMALLRAHDGISSNYYGVLKPAYSNSIGATGYGYWEGSAAIGVDWTAAVPGSSTNYRSMTAAHEWGHNFGRKHVNCGGPDDLDLSYPYDPTSIGRYGYDLTTRLLLSPQTYVDLMSYCKPLFISDYTYRGVLDYRASPGGAVRLAVPQRSLLVWGRIGVDGVILEPSFEIVAPPSLPTRPGPYTIEATDESGHVIFSFAFEGEAIDHSPNTRGFTFVVPLAPTGAAPATLKLVANGREAVLRTASPSAAAGDVASAPPEARLTHASGTLAKLEWNAARYPMALVRDPATGHMLSIARGGVADISSSGKDLDVIFSDGVVSVRRLVPITPR